MSEGQPVTVDQVLAALDHFEWDDVSQVLLKVQRLALTRVVTSMSFVLLAHPPSHSSRYLVEDLFYCVEHLASKGSNQSEILFGLWVCVTRTYQIL